MRQRALVLTCMLYAVSFEFVAYWARYLLYAVSLEYVAYWARYGRLISVIREPGRPTCHVEPSIYHVMNQNIFFISECVFKGSSVN